MTIPVKRTVTKHKVVLKGLDQGREFLVQQVRDEIGRVALLEVKVQISKGNNPTTVVVDGNRAGSNLSEADVNKLKSLKVGTVIFPFALKRIQWFFVDNMVLWAAVQEAWFRLKRKLARVTGDAWRSVYFYCNDPDNPSLSGKRMALGGVKTFLQDAGSNASVSIKGPRTEYRRTVIYSSGSLVWAPPSRAKSSTIERDRVTFGGGETKTTNRGTSTRIAKAINHTVVGTIKRKYKRVSAFYRFVPERADSLPLPILHSPKWRPKGQNVHIPVMIFSLKKRSI